MLKTSHSARVVAFAAMVVLVTPNAYAAEPSADGYTWERRVSTAGLDLSTSEGESALRHRIRAAAADVCSNGAFDSVFGDDFRACFQKAFTEGWVDGQKRVAAARSKTLVAEATQK